MTVPAILVSDKQLRLAKRQVAADLTNDEFDQFIHQANISGLDPLRKQIYAIVYNAKNPKKRKVVFFTGIDGYRTIADRSGCYAPGERTVLFDENAIDDITNPDGIVSATAEVEKYVHGRWVKFSETALWTDFAPLKEIWAYDEAKGERVPTGKFELDRSGNWAKMPATMLKKCAEAQALRRGWPDSFSGLYVDAEQDVIAAQHRDSEMKDVTPSELVEQADRIEREQRVGGPALVFDFGDNKLEPVRVNDVFGRVQDFLRDNKDEVAACLAFRERNAASLRQYWTLKGDEALRVKQQFEAIAETIKSEDAA